jgi:protein-disulfide isomerase
MTNSMTLIPATSERDHSQGPHHPLVTLVEYGDYQCPACGAAYPVVKALQKRFSKELRFIFRNFPLTQSHPFALAAADTAEAAALQGKFWQMHDLLFQRQHLLEPPVLASWAQEIGLDLEKLKSALTNGQIAKRIREDRTGAIHSGVSGTPGFFINGAKYEGTAGYLAMRTAVEQLIAGSLQTNHFTAFKNHTPHAYTQRQEQPS